MPNVSYSLTTTARVKTRLGLSGAGFDALIDMLVNGVTDWIESQCGGRRFKEGTYTNEVYDGQNVDGSGKRILILKSAPVASLTSFQYRTGTVSSPTWVDFDANSYELKSSEGIIYYYGDELPKGIKNIRVSYIAGYKIDFASELSATHTLPFDVSNLAEKLVVKEFKHRESIGKSQETSGDSSITWKDGLDQEDLAVLGRYQRFQFI
jgi:hypothetical protein